MSECYDRELCDERHTNIKEVLLDHENRLNDHSRRLGILTKEGSEYKTEIKNLIKKMDDFMVTLKWGLGIFVTVSIFVIGVLLKK